MRLDHLWAVRERPNSDDACTDRAPFGRASLFPLGRLVATPGALRVLTETGTDPRRLVARHAGGDWGDVDAEDWATNDRASRGSARVVSDYQLENGERIWIITEADRSATTLLLPSEY